MLRGRDCEGEMEMDHYGVGSKLLGMDELSLRVLKEFIEMGSELLDL
jgi:hypothetical protein